MRYAIPYDSIALNLLIEQCVVRKEQTNFGTELACGDENISTSNSQQDGFFWLMCTTIFRLRKEVMCTP